MQIICCQTYFLHAAFALPILGANLLQAMYGSGILCIVMFNAISGIFRGMGDSKTPLWLMGIAMFAVSFFQGVWLAHFFTSDREVMLAAADYLKSYSIDCVIVGINFRNRI